jgi:hypothetical protein
VPPSLVAIQSVVISPDGGSCPDAAGLAMSAAVSAPGRAPACSWAFACSASSAEMSDSSSMLRCARLGADRG